MAKDEAKNEGSVGAFFAIAVVGGVIGGLTLGNMGALAGAWIPTLIYALGLVGGEKELTASGEPVQRGATLVGASLAVAALPAAVGSVAGFVAAALR
jgi:hypothetical protein